MFRFILDYQYIIFNQSYEIFKEFLAAYSIRVPGDDSVQIAEGVEVTTYNVGGFTATLVALMAQRKVSTQSGITIFELSHRAPHSQF